MFRKYGLIGILLILFVELNFIFKIEPFASWYFPIIWFGYILVVDAIVYKLRKESLISNRIHQFLGMIIISAFFWWAFEFANITISNWTYSGLEGIGSIQARTFFGFLSFSTVLPALFETVELLRSLKLFEHKGLHREFRITKRIIHLFWALGIISFIAPIVFPKFAFPLVWLSFFFILDPINYLHKQPSIIGFLNKGKWSIPLSLASSGIILGFFWEFWNYWAIPKWTYHVPYVGFLKIFEMPVLGYLGYIPFTFELYAMYFFVRSLFIHKEHLLCE
jgi:hypothetical protein